MAFRLLKTIAEHARALDMNPLYARVLPENAAYLGLVRVVFRHGWLAEESTRST